MRPFNSALSSCFVGLITISGILLSSTPLSAQVTNSRSLLTWEKFVQGMRNGTLPFRDYFGVDYNLPKEFRNGIVYKVQGANWIGYLVLRSGLSNYPTPLPELSQVSPGVIERSLEEGQAIYFTRGLGHAALEAHGRNNKIRFPSKGTGCLRTTCLTAPTLNNTQISRILQSAKRVY